MGTATFVSVARTKFKESKICLTQQQSNESTQKKNESQYNCSKYIIMWHMLAAGSRAKILFFPLLDVICSSLFV